ncbi:hypothetical protein CMK14_19400 [Candidatus Poribacteria bacterium]|nr:hypothetical protein [Candidatus Poribacteria bacterium]
MKVCIVADIMVHDLKTYQKYIEQVPAIVADILSEVGRSPGNRRLGSSGVPGHYRISQSIVL